MTDHWLLGSFPGDSYLSWVTSGDHAFASPGWANVLAKLGMAPLFGWDEAGGAGVLVGRVLRGPLSIGVCGQPTPGPAWDAMSETELIGSGRRLAKEAGLDLLRVNLSMQAMVGTAATAARPEAWITDLNAWHSESSARRRKDLALARRANQRKNCVVPCADADAIHSLYAATVLRHGGRLRYPVEYFRALTSLAKERDSGLRVLAVKAPSEGVRGFAVLALHEGCGYYLHGALSEAGRREGVSDLLVAAMIDEARAAGCKRFTHMASPWDQPGLIAFKAKWSDSIGYAVTYDIAATPLGALIRNGLRWRARKERANVMVAR